MPDRTDPVVTIGCTSLVLAALFIMENALIAFAVFAWLLWKFPIVRIVAGLAFAIVALTLFVVYLGSGPLRKKK